MRSHTRHEKKTYEVGPIILTDVTLTLYRGKPHGIEKSVPKAQGVEITATQGAWPYDMRPLNFQLCAEHHETMHTPTGSRQRTINHEP